MLLAFSNAAVPGERVQQKFVDTLVKRSQRQPLLEIFKAFVIGNGSDELLEQRSVAQAEPTPLHRDPAAEGRASVDLQAFEKVSGEQRGEGSQPVRSDRLNVLGRLGNLNRIDDAVRQIKSDSVGLGLDPSPTGLIYEGPDLAEAPAKFSPRIIGDVPQQFAKLAPRDGARGKRQIRKKTTHLA